MQWVADHTWETWLIAALVLAGAELTTLDLTLLMMGVGAGAGSLMAGLGLNVYVQVLVAVAVAIAMLSFVRPPIVRRLHAAPTVHSGTAGLVGQSGLVLEEVTGQAGRIKLHGEVWSARAIDDRMLIEPGRKVAVAQIEGATAVVYPLAE